MIKTLFHLSVNQLEHSGFSRAELVALHDGKVVETVMCRFCLTGAYRPELDEMCQPQIKPVKTMKQAQAQLSPERQSERRAELCAENAVTGFEGGCDW